MMNAQFYKWLKADGSAPIGRGKWRPGKWRSVEGELIPCENGLHLCRRQDLLPHISEQLWIAEADTAEMIEHEGNKIVVRRARILRRVETINDCTMRLFACDCADRVVLLTKSDKGKNCIAVARRYAHGEATDEELAAARDAAWAAVSRAANDAAWDAREAACAAAWTADSDAARAAREAAWDATQAACAAAGAAAWTAALDAARAAAWTAALNAANDAAWTADLNAARAANDAACAAAWTAASDAQVQRFLQYIEHGAAAETMPWPEAQ
jgi:hypothetical protein